MKFYLDFLTLLLTLHSTKSAGVEPVDSVGSASNQQEFPTDRCLWEGPGCRVDADCTCDADCLVYSQCCLGFNVTNIDLENITVAGCYSVTKKQDIILIDTCSVDGVSGQQCLYRTDKNAFVTKDDIPVFSSNTKVYRNRECALCNGIQPDDIQYCKYYVGCRDVSFVSFDEAIHRKNTTCELELICRYGVELRHCIPGLRSDCNGELTGLCSIYNSPVSGVKKRKKNMFKNRYCAECNGYGDIQCVEDSSFMDIIEFSMIIDFNRVDGIECNGFVYKGGCLAVECPGGWTHNRGYGECDGLLAYVMSVVVMDEDVSLLDPLDGVSLCGRLTQRGVLIATGSNNKHKVCKVLIPRDGLIPLLKLSAEIALKYRKYVEIKIRHASHYVDTLRPATHSKDCKPWYKIDIEESDVADFKVDESFVLMQMNIIASLKKKSEMEIRVHVCPLSVVCERVVVPSSEKEEIRRALMGLTTVEKTFRGGFKVCKSEVEELQKAEMAAGGEKMAAESEKMAAETGTDADRMSAAGVKHMVFGGNVHVVVSVLPICVIVYVTFG